MFNSRIDSRFAGALGIGFLVAFSGQALANDPDLQAYRTHVGVHSLQLLGWSVASVGDLNQDGVNDYAIGSPGYAGLMGGVFVYSGADGTLIHELQGQSSFGFFGWSVAGAGDVNADGVPDVIVGAPFHFAPGPVGRVTVFSGSTGATIYAIIGTNAAEAFGYSVDGAGDVDGDGYADFVVGAPTYGPTNAGRILVYSGVDGAQILNWPHVSGGNLGISVAGAGDVNGDGFDDVLAGAPGAGQVIVVDVYHDSLIRIHYGSAQAGFGWSVANVRDVNGDGVNDFAVGVPSAVVGDRMPGRAIVYDGSSGGPIRQFDGEGLNDGVGFDVAAAGDFNGDGSNDVLIGAPWHDGGGPNSGRVEIRDSATGALLRTYYGYLNQTHFASAVAALGDINDDGMGDILVGAPMAAGFDRGAAFIYSGAGAGALFGQPGGGTEFPNDGSPPACLIAADLNLDGRADVVMVSPTTGRLVWRYATPSGGLSPVLQQYVGSKPTSVAAGDFDGDGDIDLAIAMMNENRVTMMRNPGWGLFHSSGKINVGRKPVSVAAGDLNSDGRADLVVACRLDDEVTVLRQTAGNSGNLASRFVQAGKLAVQRDPIQVAIAKLDPDSKPDLAVLNYDSGSVSVLRNKGAFAFAKQRAYLVGSKPLSMAIADFNRDGRGDIAYVRQQTSGVSIRFGGPDGLEAPVHMHFAGGPGSIAAVDMNMDGWRDLITANVASPSVTLLLNHADGTFASPQFVPATLGPKFITAGDVDRDGDPDVITAGSTISVLMNDWY